MKKEKRNICPCCNKSIVSDYAFCKVCGWQNDPVQKENPDFAGGANIQSLNNARRVYFKKTQFPIK